ncbi:MAG: hypothetical protein AAGA57_03535 [Planctomycetota bacterium]
MTETTPYEASPAEANLAETGPASPSEDAETKFRWRSLIPTALGLGLGVVIYVPGVVDAQLQEHFAALLFVGVFLYMCLMFVLVCWEQMRLKREARRIGDG